MSQPTLGIIVPCFNEEEVLPNELPPISAKDPVS